jgi:hypothetical protein
LKNVTYNTATQSISGTVLGTFLYTQGLQVIDFSLLTRNTITMNFGGLPIHQKLIARARLMTECTTENKTVQMTLSGPTPTIINLPLTSLA